MGRKIRSTLLALIYPEASILLLGKLAQDHVRKRNLRVVSRLGRWSPTE